MEWQHEEFTISDKKNRLNIDLIHDFLCNSSYWAAGVSKEIVIKSIDNSLCLGLFKANEQIGFGRAITDRATFAYLADVFIIEKYRGQGLGKWLVSCMLEHPELQDLRRWLLGTRDAHGLYQQYGFVPLLYPEIFMTIHKPVV